MEKLITVRMRKEDAVEAVTLTGARSRSEALRVLLDEARRTRRRRRVLERAGTLAIDYVRPDDRGRR
jgi:hypothetical protein